MARQGKGRLVCRDMLCGPRGCGLKVGVAVGRWTGMQGARLLFGKLPSAFVRAGSDWEHGEVEQAEDLVLEMTDSSSMFVDALRACGSAGDLLKGRSVHAAVAKAGVESSVMVGSALVDMYVKCGRLADACRVFGGLARKNVVTWNVMLGGYVRHGLAHAALDLYSSMLRDGSTLANSVTFVFLLKACGSVGALLEGIRFHAQIVEQGLEANAFVGSALVVMYLRCGSLEDARKVFDRLLMRDAAAWNAMMAGYVQHGLGHEALQLYGEMREHGTELGGQTLVIVLKACSSIGAVSAGKQLHSQILERGLEADVFVGSSLLDMYLKCGRVSDAFTVFRRLSDRDVVVWNAVIAGCVLQGLCHEALTLYASMQNEGWTPSEATFVSALKACGGTGFLQEGKQIHAQMLQMGLEVTGSAGNTLVYLYAKCGSLEDARKVFDRLSGPDAVTWNAMISGYVQHGLGQEALDLYAAMKGRGFTPDEATLVCALKACGSVGALQEGKLIHAHVLERGLQGLVSVGNTLVDMYAKCGSLVDARTAFEALPERNVVTWNALINGYGHHNDCTAAIHCFHQMQQQRIEPDAATFTALLTACSHVASVDEGQLYFNMLVEKYSITPTIQHQTCMVDLLGRSGRLAEAEALLQTIPLKHSAAGWRSLLRSCGSHSDIVRARSCFDCLVDLEPQQATGYALMSSIYTDAGMFQHALEIELLRACAGARKKPAKALIEVNNKVHEFTVGEQRNDLFSKLRGLELESTDAARDPNTAKVLNSSGQREVGDALCGHAEKLALAFGLLNTPEGTSLLVVKNLRMCDHCHNGTKVISRLEQRDIVVRDAHRTHHFHDGMCSCGDNR